MAKYIPPETATKKRFKEKPQAQKKYSYWGDAWRRLRRNIFTCGFHPVLSMGSPLFTSINGNTTTTVRSKLPGKTNKPVPLHDPGHLGAHTRFPIRAPAEEAVAGIGAALAPLERSRQDRGRLMGYGNKAFAFVNLRGAVLLIPYLHGAIPISIPGA